MVQNLNKKDDENSTFIWFFLYNKMQKFIILAEGPGVARGKKRLKKKLSKTFEFLCHPPATPECPQKISAQSVQPFGRL